MGLYCKHRWASGHRTLSHLTSIHRRIDIPIMMRFHSEHVPAQMDTLRKAPHRQLFTDSASHLRFLIAPIVSRARGSRPHARAIHHQYQWIRGALFQHPRTLPALSNWIDRFPISSPKKFTSYSWDKRLIQWPCRQDESHCTGVLLPNGITKIFLAIPNLSPF